MERFINNLFDFIGVGLLVLTVVMLFVGVPWFAIYCYREAHAETFSLRKDEWRCTATHIETSSVKTMHHEYAVCDQWTRG